MGKGKANACGLAHTRLIQQCPAACSQCSLAEAHCVARTPPAFDCNAAFNNWKAAWSQEKKGWCCQHAHKGCNSAATQTSFPFDCNAMNQNKNKLLRILRSRIQPI